MLIKNENRIFLIFETFKCRKKTMPKTALFKTSETPWSNPNSSMFKRIKKTFPTRFPMPFLKSRDFLYQWGS
jgi:hypothetical protein